MKSSLRAAQVEGNPDVFVAGDEAKASEDHGARSGTGGPVAGRGGGGGETLASVTPQASGVSGLAGPALPQFTQDEVVPDPLVVGRIDDPLQRLNSEDFEVSVSHVFPDAVARRHGEDELRLRRSLVALEFPDGDFLPPIDEIDQLVVGDGDDRRGFFRFVIEVGYETLSTPIPHPPVAYHRHYPDDPIFREFDDGGGGIAEVVDLHFVEKAERLEIVNRHRSRGIPRRVDRHVATAKIHVES